MERKRSKELQAPLKQKKKKEGKDYGEFCANGVKRDRVSLHGGCEIRGKNCVLRILMIPDLRDHGPAEGF
jgi:hypothetical protein